MLELTRKVGESVRLGPAELGITVTVGQLKPQQCAVTVERTFANRGSSKYHFDIKKGESILVPVGNIQVHIHLLSVIRGEARLGFEAPRIFPIDRVERT